MSEQTCSTCRHWKPPARRDGYGEALTVRVASYPAAEADYEAARKATYEADRTFGECGAIVMNDDLELGSPIPLATVRDGSDYRATLYTQAEFSCAMHEAATSPT